MDCNKPDFLVVGAAKSGTTSLFKYLNQHPDIYIPEIKEGRFFSQLRKKYKGLGAEKFVNNGVVDEQEYFSLYKGYDDKICGDISNDYLYYHQRSIENIKKYLKEDVKIIIILRNPVERAYSNYLHAVREGWEDSTFEEAISKENSRILKEWAWPYHYFNVGLYYSQVKSYMNNFENVKIFMFEELKSTDQFLWEVFEFLDITKVNINSKKRYNKSGYPRYKFLINLHDKKFIKNNPIKKILPKQIKEKISIFFDYLKRKNLEKKPMSPYIRKRLTLRYKEDIKKLEELINKDLRRWYNYGM